MRQFAYQRTIIAYHGCDQKVKDDVLLRGMPLVESTHKYDWLGRGSYFWEYGPQRALEWAKEQGHRNPAVLGAMIHLGNCFDLLDTRDTDLLRKLFPAFQKARRAEGVPIPKNDLKKGGHYRDCAVINWTIDSLEKQLGRHYHTVRGVFQEGKAAFTGSAIRCQSHIQIAVRDRGVIIGYFRPALDKEAF
jgi:hypothetical protein